MLGLRLGTDAARGRARMRPKIVQRCGPGQSAMRPGVDHGRIWSGVRAQRGEEVGVAGSPGREANLNWCRQVSGRRAAAGSHAFGASQGCASQVTRGRAFPQLAWMRSRQAQSTIGGDEGKLSVILQSAGEF